MVARVGPLIPRPAVSIRTAYSDYRTRFARFMLITTATTTINKELRCLIGRLHRATGLHTGMLTVLQTRLQNTVYVFGHAHLRQANSICSLQMEEVNTF